jgi:hypothetical protein
MEILKNLSVYLVLLIIVGAPSFFWVRWVIRSFMNKRKLAFTVAAFSYLLFISGWALITLAPAKYFKHDASESAMAIYNYFFFTFIVSITIVLVYFLAKAVEYVFVKVS